MLSFLSQILFFYIFPLLPKYLQISEKKFFVKLGLLSFYSTIHTLMLVIVNLCSKQEKKDTTLAYQGKTNRIFSHTQLFLEMNYIDTF